MQLNRLKLVNFRNYKDAEVGALKRAVILVGNNAQGKTNFLEAVYILAITKSFRLRSDLGLLGPEAEFARIEARFESRKKDSQLEVIIKKGPKGRGSCQKIIKLDGLLAPARAILGAFLAVLFCPEDINLIKTVPSGRRRFLDILGCQISSDYCEKLVEYNKIVKNRNQVLLRIKQGVGSLSELVFWNNELVDKGSFIVKFRRNILRRLDVLARQYYNRISGEALSKKQGLNLHYLSSFHLKQGTDEEGIKLRFRGELLKKQKSEVDRQQTFIGPHRDDFNFLLDKRNVIYQASRGEFRTAILSLKLAELDFLEEELSERPILLLDDVFSELDAQRQKRIATLLERQQTFITTTDLSHIAPVLKRQALILRIKSGRAKEA